LHIINQQQQNGKQHGTIGIEYSNNDAHNEGDPNGNKFACRRWLHNYLELQEHRHRL
jgi:hypothetical protein